MGRFCVALLAAASELDELDQGHERVAVEDGRELVPHV